MWKYIEIDKNTIKCNMINSCLQHILADFVTDNKPNY